MATETWRDQLKAYRRSGFDDLLPKGRADRGRSRALPPERAQRLLSLKEEPPQLSIPQLIRIAREREISAEPSHSLQDVRARRVATVALERSGGGSRLTQLKGLANAEVSPATRAAADVLAAGYGEPISPLAAVPSGTKRACRVPAGRRTCASGATPGP